MSDAVRMPQWVDVATWPRARSVDAFAAFMLLSACVPSSRLTHEQALTPRFDPIAFFAGHTKGVGSLKVITKRRQQTLVAGHGTVTSDGGIVLNQEVRRGGIITQRTWRLHCVAADRYAGTLSDASGPVSGEVAGNRLHLSFAMEGGLRAEQWLYLQPSGNSARNRMIVTKLGIPVASLDETIQRVPPE